ncbi:MAG: penicillin acylase family protein, partial [Chloroflexi bacterium]|nr:penicillin acylase family protein [Chloroflexota bacterium]
MLDASAHCASWIAHSHPRKGRPMEPVSECGRTRGSPLPVVRPGAGATTCRASLATSRGYETGPMPHTRTLRLLLTTVALLASLIGPLGRALADDRVPRWLTLAIGDERAHILRDDYGVPHISAPSNRALFYAYGYAVAQDRLWQLDLFRRAARGTMAEVLGASALASDRAERRDGYTEAEYQALFDALPDEAQLVLSAYRNGINAYRQVVLGAPETLLPWEFHRLGYTPAPWEVTDSLAISRFMASRWGGQGGREVENQALLQSLISAHGQAAGTAMYRDLRWRNDPDAPTSVPPKGATALAQAPAPIEPRVLPGVERVAPEVRRQREAALKVWETYGIPTKLGSFAFAVAPSRSASGHAMLYGGPQMGWDTPDYIHQVQLTGGEGFDVIGMAFAGAPLVSIGYNRHIAWSVTSGMGDNTDVYAEQLRPGKPEEYRFNNAWQSMITRTETISVAGRTEPVIEVVRRTVHGPVIAMDLANNLAYSVRRTQWQQETGMFVGMLDMLRAATMADFARGVESFRVSNHLLYADITGNIAYWHAGTVPIRPDGSHSGLLPWKGDGTEEWCRCWRPIPYVANPEQGYLANWNNKP